MESMEPGEAKAVVAVGRSYKCAVRVLRQCTAKRSYRCPKLLSAVTAHSSFTIDAQASPGRLKQIAVIMLNTETFLSCVT